MAARSTLRVAVALVCADCGARNYKTTRLRARDKALQLKKFCPKCAKHTVHNESK